MITTAKQPSLPVVPAPRARDYISWSAISTYASCPLRYYFRYIVGLPERMVSASLVFGGAVHRAVQLHFTELLAGKPAPSLESLLGEYDRYWQEVDPQAVHFGKEDDVESLGGLAQRMLAAFQTSQLAKPEGHILGVEEELRGPIIPGCPDVLGRLDLIVETSDAVIITDLKTARSRWSREQVDDSAGQLLLYHELARDIAPHKRLRLQFAVITKAKAPAVDLYEVLVGTNQIDRTKKIVEKVWHAIESGTFYPAPSPMQCPSCPYREPCRAWQG
jgi:CRISPR/Cas system-associated exonuclease Cas4 (RecB family)